MDDRALGDGYVDEGLDGVVLGGRLCGGSGCQCEGGVGCGGWGVLAWVRVRVRAVSVGFVSLQLWCCVCSLGRRFGFGVGFGVGVWFPVEEYLCPEVSGRRCWVRGLPGASPGCLSRLCGGRGVGACGRGFGFCRGLEDEGGGLGGVGG